MNQKIVITLLFFLVVGISVAGFVLLREENSKIRNEATVLGEEVGGIKNRIAALEVAVEELKVGEITLRPDFALCGSKFQAGPLISGDWEKMTNCTQEVTNSDKVYGYARTVEGEAGRGVTEILFLLPEYIEFEKVISVTTKIEMWCKGGIGINVLTELGEWTRIGKDLPSEGYKPDGSYGYLACGYDSMEQKTINVTESIHGIEFGVRVSEDEMTSEAWVDRVSSVVKYWR